MGPIIYSQGIWKTRVTTPVLSPSFFKARSSCWNIKLWMGYDQRQCRNCHLEGIEDLGPTVAATWGGWVRWS